MLYSSRDSLHIRMSRGYFSLAAEVEIARAEFCLSKGYLEEAVGIYKEFEGKEAALRSKAATNLSFIYMLEGILDDAQRFADKVRERKAVVVVFLMISQYNSNKRPC